MDAKEAARLMANADTGQKKNGKYRPAEEPALRQDSDWARYTNHKENAMLDAIDQKRVIERYVDAIEKMQQGKLSPEQFMGKLAPDVLLQLLQIAVADPSSKMRLDAAKDFLDRAGLSAVKKMTLGVGQIDPNAPRAQLEAQIEGLARKTRAIEIEDDVFDVDDAEPIKD